MRPTSPCFRNASWPAGTAKLPRQHPVLAGPVPQTSPTPHVHPSGGSCRSALLPSLEQVEIAILHHSQAPPRTSTGGGSVAKF